MKKKIFFIALFLGCEFTYAQLSVNGALTPTQMVQNVLLGPGVTVSNVTYTGNSLSRGTFDGTLSNIGLAQGLILCSGDINNAVGPNNQQGAGIGLADPGDPDLTALIGGEPTNDASILEFDFVPMSDTVKFRYLFGSDEYMEWVGGGVNDDFGFFISGPGISGPYSNNSKNIAFIPGTGTAIAIDNVNLNVNPQYYIDNGNGGGSGTAPDGLTVQYDGFTVPFTAVAAVQCGQTYHIKMAVADAGDLEVDTGVLLEAGSFSSKGLVIYPKINNGGADDSILYEGCASACLYFVRSYNLSQADTINLTIGGDAVNGTDYYNNLTGIGTLLPSQLFFAPGQDSLSLCITAVADGITEGLEKIDLSITSSSGPCTPAPASAHIWVGEYSPLTLSVNDTTLCPPGGMVNLQATVTGGLPPYTYSWNNGLAAIANPSVNVSSSTTYILTVNDACNGNPTDPTSAVTDSAVVTLVSLNANAGNDQIICPGETTKLHASNGINYSWHPTTALSCTNCQNPIASPDEKTSYCVTITDNKGCIDSACVTVDVSCAAFYIPDAFTPNADGKNEVFKPIVLGVHNYRFQIFDRWGELIFETTTSNEGWNGYYHGRLCEQAVYTYKINFVDDTHDEQHSYIGRVTLLR